MTIQPTATRVNTEESLMPSTPTLLGEHSESSTSSCSFRTYIQIATKVVLSVAGIFLALKVTSSFVVATHAAPFSLLLTLPTIALSYFFIKNDSGDILSMINHNIDRII